MHNKITVCSLFLFLSCASIVYFTQIQKQTCDQAEYRLLVKENMALGERKSQIEEPARQFRTGVQKDIWVTKDSERTQFRLKCENSDLVIRQKDRKLDMVEYLHNLECLSQEGINRAENKQELKALTALEGIYYFPSHRFTANTVDLFFYHIPGIILPETMPHDAPYLRGRAYDIAFTAEDKTLQFTAHHLKANFDTVQVRP